MALSLLSNIASWSFNSNRTSKTVTSGYRFTPLKGQNGIRLLVLDPSIDPAAPLSGSLLNTTIWECDADFNNGYLALSYVWGDPTRTNSIQLDGAVVGITTSLAEALRRLRHSRPGETQRVWADALCINQSDTKEKNRQVPLMGTIYSHAKATIIYLGPLTTNLEDVFEYARSNAPRVTTVDDEGNTILSHGRDVTVRDNWGRWMEEEEPSSKAIDELLSLPWFTRAWVFQELAFSCNPWVQCGHLRISWKLLCTLMVPLLDRTKGKNVSPLQQMHSAYLKKKQTLCEILRSRHGCQSSDPRGMVFAYMGMHSDREKVSNFITVDYDVDLRALLISTARYIFESYGFSQLLRCTKRCRSQPSWLELPSWVPDWGISDRPNPTPLNWPVGQADEPEPLHVLYERDFGHGITPNRRLLNYKKSQEISHLSPILPHPSDMPAQVTSFLRQMQLDSLATKTHVPNDDEKRLNKMVDFAKNLVLPQINGEPPRRLFRDSFWNPYPSLLPNEVARHRVSAARQIISFLQTYMKVSDSVNEGFSWEVGASQTVRLGGTSDLFVVALPAHGEIGDYAIVVQDGDGRIKKPGFQGYHGFIVRPTGSSCLWNPYKGCKLISPGGVADMTERKDFRQSPHGARFRGDEYITVH